MSRSWHTEAQIIQALKQVEAGRKTEEMARQYGVSHYTIYAWKAKCGGMELSEAQEVKQLHEESARLKRLVADLSLDKEALQSVIWKEPPGLAARRAEVQRLMADYTISQRHACELMEIPRSTCQYASRRDDGPLREQLVALAQQQPRFGYRRLHVLLRHDGWPVNHKRVQRVYRTAGLTVKRLPRGWMTRSVSPRTVLTAPNQEWAIDFASDMMHAQQRLRIFSVVDAYTRECLALEVDTSFPSRRVTRVLGNLMAIHGGPTALRSDNGPELCSRHYLAWCLERRV